MTAKDLLNLNGDFCNSPLLDTARRLHGLLARQDIAYVPLPDPVEVLEYDVVLQANFLTLPAILELKTATYLRK